MTTDNSAALHAAQQARHAELVKTVTATVRRLKRDNVPITYNAVATAAGVSRAFLYKTPETRTLIDRARTAASPTTSTRPAPRRSGPDVAALRHDNTQLRQQLRVLTERNERLLGLLRESKRPTT